MLTKRKAFDFAVTLCFCLVRGSCRDKVLKTLFFPAGVLSILCASLLGNAICTSLERCISLPWHAYIGGVMRCRVQMNRQWHNGGIVLEDERLQSVCLRKVNHHQYNISH